MTRKWHMPYVLVLLVVMTLSWAGAQQVNNTNDTGVGSLREAIANASNGDTITFDASLAGQTITLGSALPNIAVDNLTIDASALGLDNKVTVERDAGAGDFGIFAHTGNGTLTINNLVVTGGKIPAGAFGSGGGIISFGSIIVTNSTISGNEAFNGGGLRSSVNLTVTNSTISGNFANGNSGGGFIGGGIVTVTNSTISGNSATQVGGGISAGSAVNLTVTNSTISGNSANNGGGIFRNGAITLNNSLVLGNTANANPEVNVTPTATNSAYGFGAGESEGDVFVGKTIADIFTSHQPATAGNPTTAGDYTLKAASPAIDAGDNTLATGIDLDLSGNLRIHNDTVDMGTYEFGSSPPAAGGGAVINPNPDIQIRNGDSTAADTISSGTTINVGSFKRGEVATVDFLVRNPGAQVLELGELSLPSFLSNAGEPLPETLASFASALLTLTVDTNTAGALEGTFSLASNDPDEFENPFVFTVQATVSETPANALNILPGIDLGDVNTATGQDDVVLLSFQLIVPEGSVSVTVDSLTLAASNLGIQRASNLRLYIDGGTRGQLDNRDVFLSTADTQSLSFDFNPRIFQPNLPMWFIVVGDF
ncbi:MAG: right-handed parallel beta-helix repeat-containing protein [Deinococcota bacterium]